MQEKNTIEQMKLIIVEREKRVKELEEELVKLKETIYSNFNNNTNNPISNQTFFLNDPIQHNSQVKTESTESEFLKSRPLSSSRLKTDKANLNRTNSMFEREIITSRLNICQFLFLLINREKILPKST